MSKAARIWSIYRDEATEHDNRLIDAWNRSLDILLIFAGLFSAVATAFIIESYQLLQPDWTEYTAKLLFVTIAAQAGSPNMTLPTPAKLATMSPSKFTVSPVARWINGFWVSSLAFSLAVALLSILAKQWLDQYQARTFSPSQGAQE
ncbi:hypothetical protein AURDEDRAFT_69726 [Auricularia subglabra TFB-10046 SS5]|nr:hypothetical protein AURDEDRAFT_69726 [Auricularia subglabra TFB-10046 SS5]